MGLSSVRRIREMVEAVNIELAEEDIRYLEEHYVPKAVSGSLWQPFLDLSCLCCHH